MPEQLSDMQMVWNITLAAHNTDPINLPSSENGIVRLFEMALIELNSTHAMNLQLVGEDIIETDDKGQEIEIPEWKFFLLSQYLQLRMLTNRRIYVATSSNYSVRDARSVGEGAKLSALNEEITSMRLQIERTLLHNKKGWLD